MMPIHSPLSVTFAMRLPSRQLFCASALRAAKERIPIMVVVLELAKRFGTRARATMSHHAPPHGHNPQTRLFTTIADKILPNAVEAAFQITTLLDRSCQCHGAVLTSVPVVRGASGNPEVSSCACTCLSHLPVAQEHHYSDSLGRS